MFLGILFCSLFLIRKVAWDKEVCLHLVQSFRHVSIREASSCQAALEELIPRAMTFQKVQMKFYQSWTL